MIALSDINDKLKNTNFDIRATNRIKQETGITPRFMDQKCTPDVLMSAAQWILSLESSIQNAGFACKTIWTSEFFKIYIREEFSKPDVSEETARSEYDKFIAQPLKTFCFAGLLTAEKAGHSIYFKVKEKEILEFVSINQRNARAFLIWYLEKVLADSGIWPKFEYYFANVNQESFLNLRDGFNRLILSSTPINNTVEVQRIFPKVLNPLCHKRGLQGAIRGRLSADPITASELLYNRENFRDFGKKSKNQTRAQALEKIALKSNNADALMNQNMKVIKNMHQHVSEVKDAWGNGVATQVHHIFPKSSHYDLKSVPENLILLTATQHNTKAHPKNRTGAVDFDYQIECLLAKLESVQDCIDSADCDFYDLQRFISVVNLGYKDIGISMNATYEDLVAILRGYQNGERINRSLRE
ncbi:hypothetical protein ACUY2T_03300 [Corynebacterium sp. 22_2729]